MIKERLARLRREMEKRNIAVYLVPTADYHESEYVGEHFKARKYITGFTGSAGTAVVTMTEAGLWTDARYFLQAAAQLEGSGVTLYRMGEEGVPTLFEYLRSALKEGEILGFDGRVVNDNLGRRLREIAEEKHGSLAVGEDLVGLIWEDRPPLPPARTFVLEEKYAGRGAAQKLADVRAVMAEKGADVHLLTSLYDIAWLLNVRGNDIDYVPVVLSYLALTKTECLWFVREEALTPALREHLAALGVETRPYDDFYPWAAALENVSVLLDRKVCNYRLCSSLRESVKIVEAPNPSALMKSIKNDVEADNTRAAHVKDAAAVCKFICWVQKNVGKLPMSELSAAEYLADRRAEQEGFVELSFDTICAYGPHAAIMHYAPTPETDVPLQPEGFLLVDSGGHYLEGTTDITRTFTLGPVTEEMKRHFTMALRSHIDLAMVRFLYGCSGLNLDVVARSPLWQLGLDYKHGTGHGVGYLLNVHEGPNGFRWRESPERSEGHVLEAGMITTDEPGFYLEGRYGIRHESELLCRKGEKNEFGQFMYFEDITFVPIDLAAVIPEDLTPAERRWLNEYHANVYKTIAPLLDEEEREWLKEATREI